MMSPLGGSEPPPAKNAQSGGLHCRQQGRFPIPRFEGQLDCGGDLPRWLRRDARRSEFDEWCGGVLLTLARQHRSGAGAEQGSRKLRRCLCYFQRERGRRKGCERFCEVPPLTAMAATQHLPLWRPSAYRRLIWKLVSLGILIYVSGKRMESSV